MSCLLFRSFVAQFGRSFSESYQKKKGNKPIFSLFFFSQSSRSSNPSTTTFHFHLPSKNPRAVSSNTISFRLCTQTQIYRYSYKNVKRKQEIRKNVRFCSSPAVSTWGYYQPRQEILTVQKDLQQLSPSPYYIYKFISKNTQENKERKRRKKEKQTSGYPQTNPFHSPWQGNKPQNTSTSKSSCIYPLPPPLFS